MADGLAEVDAGVAREMMPADLTKDILSRRNLFRKGVWGQVAEPEDSKKLVRGRWTNEIRVKSRT